MRVRPVLLSMLCQVAFAAGGNPRASDDQRIAPDDITVSRSQPPTPGSPQTFTGRVQVSSPFGGIAPSRTGGAVVND
jgi:hypothetical protein